MAINWNKFPETEPQKANIWMEPCLIIVEYELNDGKKRKRIQESYFLFDHDYGCETWDGIDEDDERVTHWVYMKDIPFPNDGEALVND